MARILIGNIKGPQGPQGEQGIPGPTGPAGPPGPLPPLANNGTTEETGKAALDAAYGKVLRDDIDQLNRDIDTAKTYFFGGRVYATKGSGDNYLSKTINLPSEFAKNDVNNYFVAVTTEGDTSVPGEMQVFVQKGIGQFTAFFRKRNTVQESDTQWFDYMVIIAH